MKRLTIRQIVQKQEGVTIIEFAIVAPIFIFLMMGVIEYGMYMVTQVTIEGAVSQAGRASSVKTGTGASAPDVATAVEQVIKSKVAGLPRANTVLISATPIVNGEEAPIPDLCLSNGPNGEPTNSATCPQGVAYIDNNHNGSYDGLATTSVGAPGQLVEIRASYPWRGYFPIFQRFFRSQTTGGDGNEVEGLSMISSTTIIRNEPVQPATTAPTN